MEWQTFWTAVGASAAVIAAIGAWCAAVIAGKALKAEERLLEETQRQVKAANDQVKESQRQVKAAESQVKATLRQARLARDQVEASMRPVLVFRMKEKDPALYLSNIGSGPALDVKFIEGYVSEAAEGYIPNTPKPLNPIGAGADWQLDDGRPQGWQHATVKYESVDGIPYRTTAEVVRRGTYKQTVTRLVKYAHGFRPVEITVPAPTPPPDASNRP
jgi:hypothetical protein